MNIKSKFKHFTTTLFLVALAFSTSQAKPEDEKFDHLLQLDGSKLMMQSNAYAGYLKVDDQKQQFYVFIESENDPATDPILVDQQGGPGGSSLVDMMMLNGPYILGDLFDNVVRNPHPWTTNASILYLDQAGVGFSPYNVD